jgi:hypothetical protein
MLPYKVPEGIVKGKVCLYHATISKKHVIESLTQQSYRLLLTGITPTESRATVLCRHVQQREANMVAMFTQAGIVSSHARASTL